MNCPVDGTTLQMMERQGVEIDYCPKCRGVWLDRGELDKIIERSMSMSPAGYDDDDYREGHRSKGYDPRKRRRGFLGDLFDFD
jgi:Zn-finger nucleic acid-binding protein